MKPAHLDQDTLDANAPPLRHALDDLLNFGSDGLTLREEGLEIPTADDVAESGLRALDEGSADVADTEGGAVGVDAVDGRRKGSVEGFATMRSR